MCRTGCSLQLSPALITEICINKRKTKEKNIDEKNRYVFLNNKIPQQRPDPSKPDNVGDGVKII